jgi:hypothetical protein
LYIYVHKTIDEQSFESRVHLVEHQRRRPHHDVRIHIVGVNDGT